MKRNLIVGAAAIALASGSATAAPPPKPQWIRVGTHVDGGAVEVDKKSIARWRDLWRGWWRVSFVQPRPDGTLVERHLELVDCRAGLASTLEIVSLSADGTVLNDVREPDSIALTQLGPPTPETTGDQAAAGICRLRPIPKKK